MKRFIITIFVSLFIPLVSVNADLHGDCPVSGDKIDHAASVIISYTGVEYEFCSEKCHTEFKEEPILYMEKALCIPCNDDDAKPELTLVHDDVKYYFCDEYCLSKFQSYPDSYLENLKRGK